MGNSLVLLVALVASAAPAFTAPLGRDDCVPDAQLSAPGVDSSDNFGTSIASDGDVIVVGMPNDELGGSAKVFRRMSGVYVFEATLKGSTIDAGDQFGAAVDVSGDAVVVGAPTDEQPDGGQGSVTFFRRIDGAWTEEQVSLGAPPPTAIFLFGEAVQVVGDTAVIGHRIGSGGKLSVYERVGGTWTHTVLFPAGGDALGEDIAFDGTKIASADWVAGAPGEDNTQVGKLYPFRREGNQWIEEVPFFPPVIDGFTRFGEGLAMDGDRLIVGAGGDDADGFLAGALYTYVRTGNEWTFEEKVTPPDNQGGHAIGRVVAVSGDWMAVGDPVYGSSAIGGQVGRVIVFHHENGSWRLVQNIVPHDLAAGDQLGSSVTIAGELVASGAINDDDHGGNSGTVWLRSLTTLDCDRNEVSDACEIAADPALDCDEDGQLDDCEIVQPFRVYTPTYAPLQFGSAYSFVLAQTPRAESDVSIKADGYSWSDGNSFVAVRINGSAVGTLFADWTLFSCDPLQGSLTIPKATFNNLITPGGQTTFFFFGVNLPVCSNSFLSARIGYDAHTLDDLDFDGVLDACTECAADLNGDGVVDATDLGLLLGGWGGTAHDLTGDGVVNAADLAIICGTWGPCPR